jgi:zinc transporter 1/2/3
MSPELPILHGEIMNIVIYKALAALIIFMISLAAVIYPIRVRAQPTHNYLLELGDALASGIFLGAALFHMLPNAISDFQMALGNINYPLAELFCAAGFLLLIFFERLSGNSQDYKDTVPYVVAVIIIIHSLIEGTVLGINTSIATAIIIFVAIIAHKSSVSFALAVILNQARVPFRHMFVLITIFSLMTPLGIAIGTTMSIYLHSETGHLVTAAFNAFAAGTFLYMSTLHHINHHKNSHHGEGLWEFFALVTGLSVMAAIAVWA